MNPIAESIEHARTAMQRKRVNNWLSLPCAAKYFGMDLRSFLMLWDDGALRAQVRHHFAEGLQGRRQLEIYVPDIEQVMGRLMENEVAA